MAEAKKKPAARKPRAKKTTTAAPAEEPKQLDAAPTYDAEKAYRITVHDRIIYARGHAVAGIVADLTRLYELAPTVEEA